MVKPLQAASCRDSSITARLAQVSRRPELCSGPDGRIPGAGKWPEGGGGAIVVALEELESVGRCEEPGRGFTAGRAILRPCNRGVYLTIRK